MFDKRVQEEADRLKQVLRDKGIEVDPDKLEKDLWVQAHRLRTGPYDNPELRSRAVGEYAVEPKYESIPEPPINREDIDISNIPVHLDSVKSPTHKTLFEEMYYANPNLNKNQMYKGKNMVEVEMSRFNKQLAVLDEIPDDAVYDAAVEKLTNEVLDNMEKHLKELNVNIDRDTLQKLLDDRLAEYLFDCL
jgi:hypothetical protein